MRFIVVFLSLLVASVVNAGELESAYQKEYAYLVAEKKALEQRLANIRKSNEHNLAQVNKEIDQLQGTFLSKQNLTDRLNRQIVDASRGVDHVENDNLLLDTTLSQANESLKKIDKELAESSKNDERLEQAFTYASDVISKDGTVYMTAGRYFLPTGQSVEGNIFNVGRVAKFGVGEQGGGILAPAGNGEFKVWDVQTQSVAQQLLDDLYPNNLSIFLFDSVEKGMEKQDEKTFGDEVDASGLVGEVIIALGIAGLILVIVRGVMLMRAGSNIQKIAQRVNTRVASGDVDGALEYCQKRVCAASNVIAATLRNIRRDRDHIEDVISESILHESSYIDKFGAAILVIAAISPLLGLLGTVTGMISTFDIITEFGTGDPKMLSSGISEALLTTKFGLVVAIPLLLLGNLLSNWGRRIKADLEQAALHMINTHKA